MAPNNYSKATIILLWITLLSGCAVEYTQLVTHGELSLPGQAYLYGRFSETGGRDWDTMHIGLMVSRIGPGGREDKNIQFNEPPNDVLGIAVSPGRYVVKGVVFTNWNPSSNNQREGQVLFDKSKQKIFMVEAGKLYYLGDYVGEKETIPERGFSQLSWRLKRVTNNFNATTADFVTTYPFLGKLENASTFRQLSGSSTTGRNLIHDTRTKEDLQKVFGNSKDKIYKVYADQLRFKPTLAGLIVFKITIKPNGNVMNCTVYSSTVNDETVETGIIKIIHEMNFGQSQGEDNVVVKYPMEFLPK